MTLVMVLGMNGVLAPLAVQAQTTVTFTDGNLETIIRQVIGKFEGDIYEADLKNLTVLKAASKGISNLSRLEYCTNLQTLYLNHNQISDISPLKKLTNLNFLSLDSVQISDISPLANLKNLNYLNLERNEISDISVLVKNEGLGYGDYIYLEYNYLDLSPDAQDWADIQTLNDRRAAVFYTRQFRFSLTVDINGQGTVVRAPQQANYYYDMSVQLTAVPEEGWTFSGWSGDLTGSTNPAAIIMNGNKSVTANFRELSPVELILIFIKEAVDEGTLTGSGPGNSASGRLGAFINMMEAVENLIQKGKTGEALQKLEDIYAKMDGEPRPPDFISGPAVIERTEQIQRLMASLKDKT
jgi:uncharacterized repeat protein (TIGR02543 family)